MDKFLAAIAIVVVLSLGIGSLLFTFQKCGANALWMGKSGFWIAAAGYCDE